MRHRQRTSDIVSDEEIDRVHAHANFGAMSRRAVVDEGVLKYFFGFDSGSTQLAILVEHNLVHRPKPMSVRAKLTLKGRNYIQAMGPDILSVYPREGK